MSYTLLAFGVASLLSRLVVNGLRAFHLQGEAFHKAHNELVKAKKQRLNSRIGFESQNAWTPQTLPGNPQTSSLIVRPYSRAFACIRGPSYLGAHEVLSKFGKVTWQVPGSILSTRACPLSSSVPSAIVVPSGSVIL
jgi:hypothetical protein